MTSSGKEFRYTGSVESGLGKPERCSETGSTGTHDNGIVLVILFSRVNDNVEDTQNCRQTLTIIGYL